MVSVVNHRFETPVRGFRHEFDPGEVTKASDVPVEVPSSCLDLLVESS